MAFLTPNANGEAAVIATFLRNQLAQVRSTTHGLTDEQWHQRSTVSDFTLATLVDHVGLVAEQYGKGVLNGLTEGFDYGSGVAQGEADDVSTYSGERLLADFDARVAFVSDLVGRVETGEITLDGPVPVPPAPWFPEDLKLWEVRWVLLHLATESARHAGHADIIRESIDGKGSYELNALADGQSWGEWG